MIGTTKYKLEEALAMRVGQFNVKNGTPTDEIIKGKVQRSAGTAVLVKLKESRNRPGMPRGFEEV
jgi:hypothetical protein